MSLSRRRFTQEFKLSAVERLQQGASAAEVSRAFEINPNLLHRWRREFRQGPGNAFPGEGKRRWEETRTAELERKVGRQTMEIDFLKGCLQRIGLAPKSETTSLDSKSIERRMSDEFVSTEIHARVQVVGGGTAAAGRLGGRGQPGL